MRTRIFIKKHKGFTLIEILFVVTSLSLLMIALVMTTMGGIRSYQRGIELSNTKEQLRKAIEEISTDVRQANPIGGTGGWESPSYTLDRTPTQTLTFNRFKADSNHPETKINDNLERISYSIIQDPDNSEYAILERIQGNSIRYIAHNLIIDTTNIPGGGQVGSHFCWANNELDNGNADNRTLIIKLVTRKFLPGSKVENELAVDTAINIRTDIGPVAGSDYSDIGGSGYSNLIAEYMPAPSSLIPPFDEKP